MTKNTEQEELGDLGPAMQALSARRQSFVRFLFDEDAPDRGLLTWSARQAGYGNADGTSSSKTLSVISSRLAHDPAVMAAIREFSRQHARTLSPEALRAVREAIRNPRHKDHLRAAALILERSDPVESTHTLKIEDHRPPTIEETAAVLERMHQLAMRAGLLLPAPLDAEYSVVREDAG